MKTALATAAGRGLLAYPAAAFPDKARAGELLAEVTPRGLAKSFICLSGAEANENAVKMARLFTGRRKVVDAHAQLSRRDAGDAVAVGRSAARAVRARAARRGAHGGPLLLPVPGREAPGHAARTSARTIWTRSCREGPDTVAAVLMEGIMGANGVFVPPPGYWRKVREICDRHGVLLIADEVLSGFGRTGRWFAVDHDGVAPDMLTMAKGLTGGYAPGGAVIVTDRIARHFDDHVLVVRPDGSYAHPLTCAAIVAAIETTARREAGRAGGGAGAGGRAKLGALAQGRPFVGEVRGMGLLWALELVRPGTREPVDAGTKPEGSAAALRRAPPAPAQARQPGLHCAAAGHHRVRPGRGARPAGGRARRDLREPRRPSDDRARLQSPPRRRQGRVQRRGRRSPTCCATGCRSWRAGSACAASPEACIDELARRGGQGPDHHQQQLRQPGPGAGGAAEVRGRSRGSSAASSAATPISPSSTWRGRSRSS